MTVTLDRHILRWRRAGDRLLAAAPVPSPGAIGRPRLIVPSPDGGRALVVAEAGSSVVDTTTGAALGLDLGASGLVAVDPSGRFAAVGGGRLAVWDLSTGQRALAVPQPVNALGWSGRCGAREACRLVTAGESLDVWDPLAGRRILLSDQTNAQAVAISADGTTVATAGWGPSVALWRLAPGSGDTGRELLAPSGGPISIDPVTGRTARLDGAAIGLEGAGPRVRISSGPVDRLALAAGGRRLVTVAGGRPRLWDAGTGAPLTLDPGCTGPLLALSPEGTYLATHRPADGTTSTCRLQTGALVATGRIRARSAPVEVIAVDEDGDVALGGGSGIVERYPRAGDRFSPGIAIDARFGGEAVQVRSLALRAGVLAAGVRPRAGGGAVARALVWDLGGGSTPTQFDLDQLDVPAVALLDPAAQLLVVAGRDASGGPVTFQVWEAATRRRLGRALGGLAGEVASLGGDGGSVVAADGTGRAYRWALTRDPSGEICAIVGRPLGRQEWATAVDGALQRYPYSPTCP
jgi:hypothetical protein